MQYKPRAEPKDLVVLRQLDARSTLAEKDAKYYRKQKKGYEGEVMFDTWTDKLQSDCLVLNDLLFEYNNTTFQIDTLIVAPEKLYPFEVKNLYGDHSYDEKDKRIIRLPDVDVTNPLLQMSRNESLLRNTLHGRGYSLPIESTAVFINPEFTLFNAPPTEPMLYHSQLNRFFKKFDARTSKLNKNHYKVADQLVSLHQEESRYSNVPAYEYEGLRKALFCGLCGATLVAVKGHYCVCGTCGGKEIVDAAVMRHVWEYKVLFPDRIITTSDIFEWCGETVAKRRIRRVLEKNLDSISKRRWSSYEYGRER
ncbi:nuclease-related domain-containing protein [Bacillus sp. FJAT-27445]|uniref:nuclease-related domain-containing protein n=1 Tax=Bacillus sp. FJAT-27445 TaxID=1679166 RepID=UPI0007442F9B|nr:nuclease-related domain-containing protein [Bacillus sp. FJAT-27445]